MAATTLRIMAGSPTWIFLLIAVSVIGFAGLPLFRFLDQPTDTGTRWQTIDGLRGFLALGVFFFHLALLPHYLRTGVWAAPDSAFLALLGPIGVSVFFMVTGFLFWSMLLRATGRPDWMSLYAGRLFRIGPLYLAVVLAMLGVVAARSGFEWREPPSLVASQVLQWLALGMVATQPDVNGQNAGHVLAGVTWTLWYEWVFYGLLVVVAPFARGPHHLAWTTGALVLCLVVKRLATSDAAGFGALFAIGMVAASLLQHSIRPRWAPHALSVAALLCLAAPFLAGSGGYSTPSALLLGGFFFFVASGATLFGLLLTRAALRLGRISYGLYLMQGLALTAVFAAAPVRQFALASPIAYGGAGLVCACALVGAAALAHLAIEQPGMALGRRWLACQRRRRAPA